MKKTLSGNTYRERVNDQLIEWVKGNPIHNTQDDECCPDFSCCHPDLLQSEEVRNAFLVADEAVRETMLFAFLGDGLAKIAPDAKVYIADGKTEIPNKIVN